MLVQGVEGSPYAIGYFGYAYYQENEDKLNVLSDRRRRAHAEQTVDDGKLPAGPPAVPLLHRQDHEEKPQVAAFINYYLTNVNEEIRDVGYFPASAEALKSAKQAWLDASRP